MTHTRHSAGRMMAEMSRRADPEKLYLARRSGLLGRVASTLGIAPERAERLVADFEAEAVARRRDRHSSGFWAGGFEWCAERLRDE